VSAGGPPDIVRRWRDMARHALSTWLASLSLAALFAACTPPSSGAPGSAMATSSVSPPHEGQRDPPLHDGSPEATPAPSASTLSPEEARVWLERQERALRCRRQRCFKLGKECFADCYRHGHPRFPEDHMRCNDSCRRSYGVEACEEECEKSAAALPDAGPDAMR